MQEALIALGRVLEAHGARRLMRKRCKAAKAEMVHVEKTKPWDFPEEGGTGWESWSLTNAKSEFWAAMSMKVKAEKRFKGLKLTFLETYPAFAGLLEKHLTMQAKEHSKLAP